MNYKDKQSQRKLLYGLIQSRYPEGCCKCTKETIGHYTVKSQIVHWLKTNGYEVWTEATFKLYGRADVIGLDPSGNLVIIEVLGSETEKMLKDKVDNYPEIIVIPVKVKDFDYISFCI